MAIARPKYSSNANENEKKGEKESALPVILTLLRAQRIIGWIAFMFASSALAMVRKSNSGLGVIPSKMFSFFLLFCFDFHFPFFVGFHIIFLLFS